jgi:CRISPR-associated protein Cas2
MRTPRVIAYDVSDDGARLRVEALVARYGRRVQYSVFEGRLSEAEVTELLAAAAPLLAPASDSLRVYALAGDAPRAAGRAGPDDASATDLFA